MLEIKAMQPKAWSAMLFNAFVPGFLAVPRNALTVFLHSMCLCVHVGLVDQIFYQNKFFERNLQRQRIGIFYMLQIMAKLPPFFTITDATYY